MPEGQIEVKISKSQTLEGQAPDVGQDREPGKPSIQTQAVNVALISLGKQAAIQGFQQYANFTGNYAAAENFNAALSAGSDILIVTTLGPVGAVAVAGKHILNIAKSFVNQAVAIRDLNLQQTRAGELSAQGSRYK